MKRDHLISSQILFTKEFIQSLHMTQFPATLQHAHPDLKQYIFQVGLMGMLFIQSLH